MTSVDILFCTDAYLIRPCAIETMMAYKWLGLYSSVNLTNNNDFCKFPFPFSVSAPIPIFLEFHIPLVMTLLPVIQLCYRHMKG